MIHKANILTIALFLLTFLGSEAIAQQCPFSEWMTFKGTRLYRNASGTAYTYVTDHTAVDADGAPNAYHPDDVGKNCRTDPHLGLDCPANAGFPNTDWWDSVLVADPSNPSRPFVQASGEFTGFFIAMTWLADPTTPATDPRRFVDSRTVPYMVFPGSQFAQLSGTGFKGDVGFAINKNTRKSTAFIVADQGGGADARLGEGSIALFAALGGQNINPRTGAGVAPGPTRYVLFPGSRHQTDPDWPRTNQSIADQVDQLMEGIGGLAALQNCPS